MSPSKDSPAREGQSRHGRTAALPWSATIAVEEIPEEGLHQELVANAAQSAAMSDLAGLHGVFGAHASFDLRRVGRGRVHVTGRVGATVGQTCVVTLEPLQNAIDEEVDVLFAPEDQIEAITRAMEEEAKAGGEAGDPPEIIEGGRIDLGKLASDVLFLGIDPYPRKEGAVFEPPAEPEDAESHPFAALKALKASPEKVKGDSPKKKGGD